MSEKNFRHYDKEIGVREMSKFSAPTVRIPLDRKSRGRSKVHKCLRPFSIVNSSRKIESPSHQSTKSCGQLLELDSKDEDLDNNPIECEQLPVSSYSQTTSTHSHFRTPKVYSDENYRLRTLYKTNPSTKPSSLPDHRRYYGSNKNSTLNPISNRPGDTPPRPSVSTTIPISIELVVGDENNFNKRASAAIATGVATPLPSRRSPKVRRSWATTTNLRFGGKSSRVVQKVDPPNAGVPNCDIECDASKRVLEFKALEDNMVESATDRKLADRRKMVAAAKAKAKVRRNLSHAKRPKKKKRMRKRSKGSGSSSKPGTKSRFRSPTPLFGNNGGEDSLSIIRRLLEGARTQQQQPAAKNAIRQLSTTMAGGQTSTYDVISNFSRVLKLVKDYKSQHRRQTERRMLAKAGVYQCPASRSMLSAILNSEKDDSLLSSSSTSSSSSASSTSEYTTTTNSGGSSSPTTDDYSTGESEVESSEEEEFSDDTSCGMKAAGAAGMAAIEGTPSKHIHPCVCDLTKRQRAKIRTYLAERIRLQKRFEKRVQEIEEELRRLEQEEEERRQRELLEKELYADEYELVGGKLRRKKRSARRASMVSLGVKQMINWRKEPRIAVKYTKTFQLRRANPTYCKPKLEFDFRRSSSGYATAAAGAVQTHMAEVNVRQTRTSQLRTKFNANFIEVINRTELRKYPNRPEFVLRIR